MTTPPEPQPLNAPEERLQRIESSLAHLQHDMDSLNAALLNHFRRMQDIESRLNRLEDQIRESDDRSHTWTPESERPPHY